MNYVIIVILIVMLNVYNNIIIIIIIKNNLIWFNGLDIFIFIIKISIIV